MSRTTILFLSVLLLCILAIHPIVHAQTMTFTPSNQTTYDSWEPTYNDTITFTVTVSGLNATGISKGEVRFDFERVSNWKGICMNEGTKTKADLFFRYSDQTVYTAPRWKKWSKDKVNAVAEWQQSDNLDSFTIDITVRCEDYGAFGILRVKLYKSKLGPDEFLKECLITVPKDENGNYIADKSDTKYGYTNPALDDETGPDDGGGVEENRNRGDGLVQFEEYRGFKINLSHKRLYPNKKDVFIHSKFTGWGAAPGVVGISSGIGDASNLPSVFTLHEIRDSETKRYKRDRTVNYNSLGTPAQFGAGDAWYIQKKKAIWVNNQQGRYATEPDAYGTATGDVVDIYPAAIKLQRQNIINNTKLGLTVTDPATAERLLTQQVLGHEISHALGVEHAWEAPVTGKVPLRNPGLIQKYNLPAWNPPTKVNGWLGVDGNITGDPDILKPYLRWGDTELWVHSYTPDLDPTNQNNKFTYAYGSTVMDYDLQIAGGGNKGIWPASTFYELHNWEYQLLSNGVTPRVTANWTKRPKIIPCDGVPANGDAGDTGTDTDSTVADNTDTTPPVPTDLRLTPENGQVRLSWTPVSGTVTDYQYRYRESGGSWGDNWISMILSEPDVLTDTEFFVLSLINGTTYEFQLRAVNGESASTATASSESTPATVPGKPTSLTGDRYNQSVTLRWYPPDNDGGADVTDYQYRYSYTYETYSSWTSIGGTKRNVSIGGLTNGRQYQFQVRAKNSAGYGAESLTIYKTPATIPGAPQNLTKTVGDGEVSLYWSAPSSNGGLRITEYRYSYREGSSGSWGTETSAGTEQWKRITNLTNGTEYEFRVRAKNSVGKGPWSDTINATPFAPVAPDAPTNLNARRGDGKVTLSWTAPANSGSSSITHYEYRYATGRSSNHSGFSSWTSTYSTSTSYVVSGLTNGTQHLFQVRAVNSQLASSASNTAFQTPRAPVAPGAPTDLGTLGGDGKVTLSWTAPANSGSSSITHYEYRYATGSSSSHSGFSSWTSTYSTSTSYVVSGLTNGTQHLFQVRAVNSQLASSASNTAFQTPIASTTVPGAPTGLSVGSLNGQTRLTWTAPSNNGGASITDYEYRYRVNNTGSWGSWISSGDTSTGENIPGLISGTFYGFQVRAVNSEGESAASNTATGTAQ